MNQIEQDFRKEKLDFISFVSSKNDQIEFASKVYYQSYSNEFYELWFSDWYPESELFISAFNKFELEALVSFSQVWESKSEEIPENATINELLSNQTWGQIMKLAESTLAIF